MSANPNADDQSVGGEGYDALDEALMETFPASDPVAISTPIVPPVPTDRRAR